MGYFTSSQLLRRPGIRVRRCGDFTGRKPSKRLFFYTSEPVISMKTKRGMSKTKLKTGRFLAKIAGKNAISGCFLAKRTQKPCPRNRERARKSDFVMVSAAPGHDSQPPRGGLAKPRPTNTRKNPAVAAISDRRSCVFNDVGAQRAPLQSASPVFGLGGWG